MTVREKAELIVKDIKKEQGTNPVVIFKQIAEKEYISIHGPEHHILDGASLLVAYKNAGGEIDLEQALDRLMSEGLLEDIWHQMCFKVIRRVQKQNHRLTKMLSVL